MANSWYNIANETGRADAANVETALSDNHYIGVIMPEQNHTTIMAQLASTAPNVHEFNQIPYSQRKRLPSVPGLYAFVVENIAMYVGRSSDLSKRFAGHQCKYNIRQARQEGKTVNIAYWQLPIDRLPYLEMLVHRSGFFPWGKDGQSHQYEMCGLPAEDHYPTQCLRCLESSRAHSAAAEIAQGAWALCHAAAECGIIDAEIGQSRRAAMAFVRESFGDFGRAIYERYEHLNGIARAIDARHVELRNAAIKEWESSHTVTAQEVHRVICNELDA